MGSSSSLEPGEARDRAEFVALMRELKEEAGLTYRQLERRAAERGDWLPRSTLAGSLRQNLLPRAEFLAGYLRACDADLDVEPWLEARDRIAAHEQEDGPRTPPSGGLEGVEGDVVHEAITASRDSDEGSRPSRPGTLLKSRRIRALGAALVIVALSGGGYYALGTTVDATPSGDDRTTGAAASTHTGTKTKAPALPAAGTYRIRSAASSLCLSEPDGNPSGDVHQTVCRGSIPVYALEPAESGGYRIRSLHPVFGQGCMGVARGSSRKGAPMQDDYCGHRGTAERFRLQPAEQPRGYRIVLLHTGACVSIPNGTKEDGAPVLHLPCDASDPGQVFRFDPAPAPTVLPRSRGQGG